MAPFVFHCSDYCPFAHRAWIGLEYTKTPYTYTETNVWGLRLPVTKAFRQRSRSKTLPTLYTEGDEFGRDDSLPVLNFLDKLSGGVLIPSDPIKAYDVTRICANEISTFTSGFYGLLGGKTSFAPTEEERLAKMEAAATALDAAVGSGLAGPDEDITIADIALFPFVERAHGVKLLETYRGFTMTPAKYPNLMAWYERMSALPAVKATLWQTRTPASLATQPYDGDTSQTRTEYMTCARMDSNRVRSRRQQRTLESGRTLAHLGCCDRSEFYKKYAEDNVPQVRREARNLCGLELGLSRGRSRVTGTSVCRVPFVETALTRRTACSPQVNGGLVKVKPPAFDAAEWERLGAESTDDSYAAVAPGGSAETMPSAKKQKK